MQWTRKTTSQILIVLLMLFSSCIEPNSNGGYSLSGNSSLQGASSGNSVEIIDGSTPNATDVVDIPTETGLDSGIEGYQLPVTIAKLEVWPSARLLKATVGPNPNKETKVIISGSEKSADPSYTVVARLQGETDTLTAVTPNEDGSFELEIDPIYASQPIDVFYQTETETGIGEGIPVTAVVDDADTFKILIHEVPAIPDEDVSIQDNFVFYNYKIADDQYAIRFQDLSGGPVSTFATTSTYIQKMKSRQETTKDLTPTNLTVVYGVNPMDQSLVRMTADGQIFKLSDIANGTQDPFNDTIRNANNTNFELTPGKDYAIIHYTSADVSVFHPFYMIPLNSNDESIFDDLIFKVPESNPAINVEFAYDAMGNLVSVGQYAVMDDNGTSIKGQFTYFMKYMSNYRMSKLTLDQFIAYNAAGDNVHSFSYAHILKTDIPISNPTIKFEPNPEFSMKTPFSWIMECLIDGKKHICTFDTGKDTEPQQLTAGDAEFFQSDISEDSKFLTYVRKNTSGQSDILVRHLDSGEEFTITEMTDTNTTTTFRHNQRPTFDSGYTVFFLTGSDGINFYPAIVNLENHSQIGQFIKGSQYCNPEKFPDEESETACLTEQQIQDNLLKKTNYCFAVSLGDEEGELEQPELCINAYDYTYAVTNSSTNHCIDFESESSGTMNTCVDLKHLAENTYNDEDVCYDATSDNDEEYEICFNILNDFSASIELLSADTLIDGSRLLTPLAK